MTIIIAFGIPVLLLLLMAALIRLFFAGYRRLFFRPGIFGKTLPVSLLTMGTASVIKPAFFHAVFVFPAKLLLFVLEGTTKWISYIGEQDKGKKDPDPAYAADYLGSFFGNFIQNIITNLITLEVLTGLIIAILLHALLLGLFYDKSAKNYLIGDRLLAGWKKTWTFFNTGAFNFTNKFRQNLALIALMLVSLYIIICVTIAIPYNEDEIAAKNANTGKDTTAHNLFANFPVNSLRLNMESFKDDSTLLFAKISRSTEDSLPLEASRDLLKGNNNLLLKAVRDQYSILERRVSKFNVALTTFDSSLQMHKAMLERNISNTEGSAPLKRNYQRDLQFYLDNEMQFHNKTFQNEKAQIETEFFYYLRRWIQELNANYDGFLKELQRFSNDNLPPPFFNNYFSLASTPSPIFVDRVPSGEFAQPPQPPRPGDEWGWPGKMAAWLIVPKNTDLLLLFGMFGFGMLGAAISSFVNIQRNGNTTLPLIRDVHIVIIRGFAAAIVIFLATKGGIAIINNGASNPDPYVLFFTCLVGAVFSDRIWEWAKSHISRKYDPNNPDPKKNPDPDDPYQHDGDDPKVPPSNDAPPMGAIPLK